MVQKVEGVIPTVKHFFRGQVHHRLRKLSTKANGTRPVNIHAKQGRYCLPFESRRILDKHTVEDEALKSAVTSSFENRVLAAGGCGYGTNLVNTITTMLHRTLEEVFERRGFAASRHFLDTDPLVEDGLESHH